MGAATGPRPGRILPPRSSPGAAPPRRSRRVPRAQKTGRWRESSRLRPGVIQGRLEELGIADLMQSIEMGQKSCRLTLRRDGETCEMFFKGGQCKHARLGKIEGEDAVYPAVHWTDGDFEIDFNASPTDRTTIMRSTTGLLMEAMRLLDEASTEVSG